MALSLFAARALVLDYLNGRILPELRQSEIVHAVKCRLIGGATPVLDEHMCEQIDSQAGELRTEAASSRSSSVGVPGGTSEHAGR